MIGLTSGGGIRPLEGIIITLIAYITFIVMGITMLPYLLFKAWQRIFELSRGKGNVNKLATK